jgi:Large polyvalent protein associated domain 29
MAKYLPATEVAKLVRADLKAAFPNTKFSVRTDHGTTLNIEWTDGPARKAVDEITGKYAGQSFDGMQDMRVYTGAGHTTETGEEVAYGTDFVFTRRNISEDVQAELGALLGQEIAKEQGVSIEEAMANGNWWPAPQTVMREAHYFEGNLAMFVATLAEVRAEVTA